MALNILPLFAPGSLTCNFYVAATPTPVPTPAPTYTSEAISQWAGTGNEGLFVIIDFLGLVPGNGYVNFTVTISDKEFENGDVLIKDDPEWNQTTLKIKIENTASVQGEYFTVMMVDPDLLQPGAPSFSSYIHGMWANVQAGEVLTTSDASANVFSWYTPSPPWGAHRYTFLLFRQTTGSLELDTMRMAAGYPTGTLNTVGNKANFNASSFADELNLDLMNGKFFYMNCESNCMAYCSGSQATFASGTGSVPAFTVAPCETLGNLTIADVNSDGDDDSVFAQSQQWAGTGEIGVYTLLDFLKLSDEMLPNPDVNMTCAIDGAVFGPGTIVDRDTSDYSTFMCHIDYDAALDGKYYTLIELDPDVPQGNYNWWGIYIHGMWSNFQAGETFNSSNANIVAHAAGAPPFGSHRYTFVLLEQTDGLKDLTDYREAVTGSSDVSPGHFLPTAVGASQFAQSLNLKVATATFYYQYCTEFIMNYIYAPYFDYGSGTCLAYCSFDPDGSGCEAGTPYGNTNLYYIRGCPCVNGTFGEAYEPAPTPAPSVLPTPVYSIIAEVSSVAALNGYKSKEAFDSIQQSLFVEALVKSVEILRAPHQVSIQKVSYVSSTSARRMLLSSSGSYIAVNYTMEIYSSEESSTLESTVKSQLFEAFNSTGSSSFAYSLSYIANQSGIETNATVNRKVTIDAVESLTFSVTAVKPSPTLGPTAKPTTKSNNGGPTALPTALPTPLPTRKDSDNPSSKVSTAAILEGVLIPVGALLIFGIFYFRRELHEGVKRNGVTGGFRRKRSFTGSTGFEAFEEEGDTDNPIIHSDNNDVTDVRTRGISTSNRFRGASTVESNDHL